MASQGCIAMVFASSEVSLEPRTTAESIMAACHQEITESGDYPFACSEVALLLPVHERCMVLNLPFWSLKENRTSHKALEGSVSWARHMVCCDEAGELVYDPVHGAPMPLESYLTNFFVSPPRIRSIIVGRQLTALLDERELLHKYY